MKQPPSEEYAEAAVIRLFRDGRYGNGTRQRLNRSRVFQPDEIRRVIVAAFRDGQSYQTSAIASVITERERPAVNPKKFWPKKRQRLNIR